MIDPAIKQAAKCELARREFFYYCHVKAPDFYTEDRKFLIDFCNCLQDFYYSKGDTEHLRQVDDEFHSLICRLSRRTVLVDTLIPLHRKTRRYRRISMENRSRSAKTMKEHRAMYDAIISGDADLAMRLTTEHIANAKIHMMKGAK